MTADTRHVARRIQVSGSVQRVGFRAWFIASTRDLELTGWIRNRVDGSVEAFIQGPADAIAAALLLARRGPAMSRVEQVDVHDVPPGHESAARGIVERGTG